MKKGMLILSVSVIAVIMLFLFINSVLAITGSLGNARMILYPEVPKNGITLEKYVIVQNVNDVDVNITVEVSGNNSNMYTIIDKNFVLQPGDEKQARFKIKITKPGDYENRINVFFKPMDGKGAGVALSSIIIIRATGVTASNNNNQNTNDNSTTNSTTTNNNNSTSSSNNTKFNIIFNPMYLLIILPIILAIILIILLLNIKKRKRSVRSS